MQFVDFFFILAIMCAQKSCIIDTTYTDYYMNEGMDPEKLYTSIPDYTRMATSYPAHTLHADTTSDNQSIPISDQTAGHEYDTVPGDRKDHTSDDEYVHIPDTETQPPHREDNTAPTGD